MNIFKLEDYQKAAEYIKSITIQKPHLAIVLGSGLFGIEKDLANKTVINYSDIPNFPKTTVSHHKGQMIIGELDGKTVVIMSGRAHFYEGHSFEEVTFYVRVLCLLGVTSIILTNACGGINSDFCVGDFMLITDHIKLFSDSPVRGRNIEQFGSRFFDMTQTYNIEYQNIAKNTAKKLNINLKQGVYAFMGGPQFETPAEIKMLKALGADAVGMSTVAEAIVANQAGLKILGICCISNMAAGISDAPISDQEVVEIGKRVSGDFKMFIREIVGEIDAV
jgi:purine-nucleoside phosphorylase